MMNPDALAEAVAPARILIVEDVANDAELMTRELRRSGLAFTHQHVQTEVALREALRSFVPDIVLTDHSLPQFNASDALRVVREEAVHTPVIVVTGSLDEETAADYIKAGAADYIVKHRLQRLGPAVRRALALRQALTDAARAEAALRVLEEQQRQAQKMEAIGRLASGVAHDFNNLLTAILGSTDLLLEELAADHPGRLEAEETRRAALRAADLTRQLLAFSRQQVLAPQVLDINEVVTNVKKMLRRVIGEHVEVRSVQAPDLGAVRADPGQLEQVLLNLAVNARDAMPRGGRVTIETANADLDETYAAQHAAVAPGRYVMFAVSDTGTGMDAATQTRLFEPFFTTKAKGKGTGLGLATVYGIVKQSGGYIWVYSEPGQGTSMKVYLPRVDAPIEPITPPPPPSGSLRGSETILIVEDQEEVRNLTRRLLEARGYRVLVAASGAEALEVAAPSTERIDLLVTDVIMPRMSGREVALLLGPAQPHMKVLFVSGYPDESIVHHGVLDPGVAFLQKPFTAQTLAQKVRAVLDAPRDG